MMMKTLLVALALFGQAPSTCPNPLPAPARPSPSPSPWPAYVFRSGPGKTPPWATAARITARAGRGDHIGSGTIIDGSVNAGLILTCAHVLQPGGEITIELFGPTIDPRNGSVGRPVARYPASVVDFDPKLDVGLLRFAPRTTLAASSLVPPGWRPTRTAPLCSVGCSRSADPSAVSERYLRPVQSSGGYLGLECQSQPQEGRSGGGLFDEDGRLAGVCDFAEPIARTGIYADPESLRKILRRNGLLALADGVTVSRRSAPPQSPPPHPGISVQIGPSPPPRPPPPQPPLEPAIAGPIPVIAASLLVIGAPALALFAWLAARIRIKRPRIGANARALRPEDALSSLIATLAARDLAERTRIEQEEQARHSAELLGQVQALIDRANGPKP